MYLDCFTLLSPQVKIRVLMSMLHLAEARMEKLEDNFAFFKEARYFFDE